MTQPESSTAREGKPRREQRRAPTSCRRTVGSGPCAGRRRAGPRPSLEAAMAARSRSRRQPVTDAPDRLDVARADGLRSIFSRRRRMWTVTVPVSPQPRSPRRLHQLSREKTRPGWRARNQSRSNSLAVSRSARPSAATSRGPRRSRGRRTDRSARRGGGVRPRAQTVAPGRRARGAERLRHVVVGAELEPDDAIGLLAPRREHDHGRSTALADPAAERPARRCPGSIRSRTTSSACRARAAPAPVAVAGLERLDTPRASDIGRRLRARSARRPRSDGRHDRIVTAISYSEMNLTIGPLSFLRGL